MRDFHGGYRKCYVIMKGLEINYNFIRKHQRINCYPHELATDLELGKNKLLDLIKLSSNGNRALVIDIFLKEILITRLW